MSRTDTAVRVISASPDRVFAALTDSDAPAVCYRPTDDRPVRALRCASRRVLPTGSGVRGRVGRAGSPPSTPTWSTPWEVTPSTPDHASTSGPTMCPTGSTLQITRRDCRPRSTISPLPLNAERRLPRSTVLVATATIRVVATEGQTYARQLQQAGDYTGPHRDPHTATRTGPSSAARTAPLSAGDHSPHAAPGYVTG
jgi:hypothetical protein